MQQTLPLAANDHARSAARPGTFGSPNSLVFTAGIADESHGLLGEITPTS